MKYIMISMCIFLFSSCINTRIYIIEKGKKDKVCEDYGHFHFGPSPGDFKE